MHVSVETFNPSSLFSRILWDARLETWDSTAYKAEVRRLAEQSKPSDATALSLESIATSSPLFKASVYRLTAVQSESKPDVVDLIIDWVSRDQSEKHRITYSSATSLKCTGLRSLLVGGELLGHELTQSKVGWRHALLFIANEFAIVECASIQYAKHPVSAGEA
jgi:hypothetical protein